MHHGVPSYVLHLPWHLWGQPVGRASASRDPMAVLKLPEQVGRLAPSGLCPWLQCQSLLALAQVPIPGEVAWCWHF